MKWLFGFILSSSFAFAQSIEIGTSANGPVTMSGDVTNSSSASVVLRINGTPVSATAPTTNQVLTFDGASWTPSASSGLLPALNSTKIWVGNSGNVPVGVSSSGDATVNVAGAFKVLALQNVGISTATPSSAQVLTYNSVSSLWTPQAASGGSGSLPSLTSTKFWVGNSGGEPIAVSSSGDATFSGAGAFKVMAIQGVGIATTSPSNSNVLTYNSVSTKWEPQAAGGGGALSTYISYNRTSQVALTSGSFVTIKYNAATVDTGGGSPLYNTSTGVFTAPSTGYYFVAASARVEGQFSTTGTIAMRIAKNGSTIIYTQIQGYDGTQVLPYSAVTSPTLVSLTAGDTLDVTCFVNVGGAVVSGTTTANNWLTIMKIN